MAKINLKREIALLISIEGQAREIILLHMEVESKFLLMYQIIAFVTFRKNPM